jgi:hypothetical protein
MRADQNEMSVTVDSEKRPDKTIALIDDHREHAVEVKIPASRTDALVKQPDFKLKIGAHAT